MDNKIQDQLLNMSVNVKGLSELIANSVSINPSDDDILFFVSNYLKTLSNNLENICYPQKEGTNNEKKNLI